jgi:hypothetical protein
MAGLLFRLLMIDRNFGDYIRVTPEHISHSMQDFPICRDRSRPVPASMQIVNNLLKTADLQQV